MLPSSCWALSFPLGIENPVLEAFLFLEVKPQLSESSQIFFGLFPFIAKTMRS